MSDKKHKVLNYDTIDLPNVEVPKQEEQGSVDEVEDKKLSKDKKTLSSIDECYAYEMPSQNKQEVVQPIKEKPKFDGYGNETDEPKAYKMKVKHDGEDIVIGQSDIEKLIHATIKNNEISEKLIPTIKKSNNYNKILIKIGKYLIAIGIILSAIIIGFALSKGWYFVTG